MDTETETHPDPQLQQQPQEPATSENETIQQLSLKLLQQTELTNSLQQRIAESNRQLNQQKQLLVQARKEKHDADLEVTRLSTEVENITQELFEQANNQVREANVDAHNIKLMNERLSNTIKEKDTTIEILQSELSNLKSLISDMQEPANDTLSRVPTNNTTATFETIQHQPQPQLSKQASYIIDDSRPLPSAALFPSKSLSQYNQKLIYAPLFNQLRFDLPAFDLFHDSLIQFHHIHSITSAKQSSTYSSSTSSSATSSISYSSTSSTSSSIALETSFDIKTSKFFLKLLDELDDALKLDKAPALQTFKLRWNRKTFLQDLMDKTVTIEPLSAATEAWKNQTLQKYIPSSSVNTTPLSSPKIPSPQEASNSEPLPSLSRYSTNTPASSYDPTLFKLASHVTSKIDGVAPLAVTSSCGLCGEKRRDMNFSRIYHIKISSSDPNSTSAKMDYPLCINCANRYRSVVELLKYVGGINPNKVGEHGDVDDYIRKSWAKIVELKAKVWYSVNIGIWNDREMFGLVYGWQNDWLKDKNLSTNNKQSQINREKNHTVENNTKDTFQSVPTTPLAKETKSEAVVNGKGWDGWSGVIAKPSAPNNVDVAVDASVLAAKKSNSASKRNSIIENKDDSKDSVKETEDDDQAFEDASEGSKSEAISD